MYVNRKGLLVLMLVLVGGIYSIPALADHKSDRYAEFLLRDYREKPTKQMAEKMVQLLDQQQVSPSQGNQILQELTTPIVRTRTSYRVGKPAYFSLRRRFRIHFRHMSIHRKERIKTANDSHGGGARGGNALDEKTSYHKYRPMPKTPGVYTMQAEYEYKLISPRSKSKLKWSFEGPFPHNLLPGKYIRHWNDPNDLPVYQCAFSVTVELNVAPENEAETVLQVSNDHLDKRVTAAFTTQPNTHNYGYSSKTSKWKSTDGIQIHYTKCPVDAAFLMIYRFENGQEKIVKREILVRRETSGMIEVEHYAIRIEQAGEHSGTVILRSDVEAAYMDPEIQMIWSGELAFPMTHKVSKAMD